MKHELMMVREFQDTFQPDTVADSPRIPDEQAQDLRVNLIQEELNELKEALTKGDKTAVLDAFADSLYVVYGGIITCGMQHIIGAAFADVHDSNMSKTCNSLDEALATAEKYRSSTKDGGIVIKDLGGRYIVHRATDNKVLKSINYQAVDLKKYVE